MMFAKMQCEMCGAEAKGPLKRIKIEGAELSVCNACAKYGTEVQGAPRTSAAQSVRPSGYAGASKPPAQRSRDLFDRMGGDLVEDYPDRIRDARMKLGMTQKDLALAMMERELLVKKIEKGELIPEDEVRKKLEKTLNISLLDEGSSEPTDLHHARMTTTMGDVIQIKKAKK
ncbi:TIGR00270 family protein [Methanospirillum sp. J.3.6.1-F.2.7.3]|jgi:putative transcription factor|uniref:TIGR00270 family protein n=3 Tax=Methanospirillum TaxID=2202 RepID=A0A8E7B082_9EURY|nr:multiprotein bridging factor aMBF1 [Methanospirillum hungatei]MDX8550332.1 multiprotein bridging factor aMBF1 [Methanospirillum hungatei]NLW75978.1 TIGR00270 family protein [Methanomicrobiales archaeon]QVV88007.1 TIGR00270 family protein [Methanospirillum sp. J.3.6.1-F.2.7.3]QXO95478.1 TIGR00270 family protein [Methanospirillum hungatei]